MRQVNPHRFCSQELNRFRAANGGKFPDEKDALMAIGQKYYSYELPEKYAREIAEIGIVGMYDRRPIGESNEMGGQKFVVIGYTTEAEFRQRYFVVTGKEPDFIEPGLFYHRLSTD